MLTKLDLFNDGLSGKEDAAEKRKMLLKAMELPSDMSAKAMIEAINLIYGYKEYKRIYSEIFAS